MAEAAPNPLKIAFGMDPPHGSAWIRCRKRGRRGGSDMDPVEIDGAWLPFLGKNGLGGRIH